MIMICDLNEGLEESSEKRKNQRIFGNYNRRQPCISIKSLTRGKTGRWSEGWRDHFSLPVGRKNDQVLENKNKKNNLCKNLQMTAIFMSIVKLLN